LADCIAIFVSPVTLADSDNAAAFAIGFLADAAFSWLIFSLIDAPLASHTPASHYQPRFQLIAFQLSFRRHYCFDATLRYFHLFHITPLMSFAAAIAAIDISITISRCHASETPFRCFPLSRFIFALLSR
jgi:hypothetical protein